MFEIVEKIIQDILKSFYQEIWASLILSILLVLFYTTIKKNGVKATLKKWANDFKQNRKLRNMFYFFFVFSMIMFKTLLCRPYRSWGNELGNVLGVWSLYNNMELNTEFLENTILFIPLILFGFNAFKSNLFKDKKITFINTISKSLLYGFSFSLIIEITQFLFRIGDFQLSDLFFNTIGALIGGIIYYIVYKILEMINKRKEK